MPRMQRALITGASSGIGLALARELSARGWAVALLARRKELVDQFAAELPHAAGFTCDVGDLASVRAAVAGAREALGGDPDLAVANAGISVPTWAADFKIDDAERIIRTNVMGMFYLFDAVIPAMLARGSGRFAGVASIAGLRGLPSSSVYSASKAAMQNFLEASGVELEQRGVGVTVINPGWVRTPIIDKYTGAVPFIVPVEKAARIIANGLERGKRTIEFPLPIAMAMRIMRVMPAAVYARAMRPYAKRKIDRDKVLR
jgi:NAD(P)-dependent dehydrogenase (short-subunit alcohol dehydrogenase family)